MQTKTPSSHQNILALDVGHKRVGVARANVEAKLPQPLVTLERGDQFWVALEKLMTDEGAATIVVGLPRNLNGDDTQQTAATREFIQELQAKTTLPVHTQDEALTSRKAEEELRGRGKPFAKGDIDALAATYILEDYLTTQEL